MAHSRRHAFTLARASLPPGQWPRLLARTAVAGLIAAGFIWLLANRLSGLAVEETRTLFLAVTPGQWITASFATIASFWAVGHYDGVIHRHLATGARPADARRAGATAIAIGQTLGLGVITGALVRWRMLPDQSLWQVTKITALVALFFLSGWAVITAAVLAVLPFAPFKPAALAVLASFAGLALLCAVAPRYRRVHWPNLFVIARLLALTAIDTLTAAFALWALCPPDLALPLAVLLPAFLLAFGAGLISGAPGGIGAFEMTMLALLPHLPQEPLLAAILAWRAVYFAAPAILGAGVALRGPRTGRNPAQACPQPALLAHAARAEVGLLAQGHLTVISGGYDQAWLAGRTAHCLIGLLDPVSGGPQAGTESCDHKRAVTCLIDKAQSESKLAVIYKCTARTAVAARQLGHVLRPIAREAWLDPRSFALNTPSHAGLRRKLRRAAVAGVSVTTDPQTPDDLARIANEWTACHGGERGFSMGRFDPGYLATQRLYVALLAGKPIAFASFHVGKYEWTLDLMRHTSTIPDGTMHALVMAAIADAAALALPRFSLSAVPFAALRPAPKGWFAGCLHSLVGGHQTGLARFKSGFAPNWQTLYLAAPHRPGLALAATEIAREVHYPAALGVASHDHHAQYEIATALPSWHRKGYDYS